MADDARVVIVGAGFAGTQAAQAVARRVPRSRITVIDPQPYATMVPALPDVMSGRIPRDALVRPLEEIFSSRRNISTRRDTIESLDRSRMVAVGRAAEYPFDYAIVTAGSVPEYYGFSDGRELLHTAHTLESAEALRNAVVASRAEAASRGTPAHLVVVGAGYTGLEVATSTRFGFGSPDALLDITVVEIANGILPMLSDRERERILSYLASIGVTLRTGVALERVDGDTAILSDGSRITHAVVCWSAGMRAAPVRIDGAEIETAGDGRSFVTEYLSLQQEPRIFLAGDLLALPDGDRLRRRAVNFSYYSGRAAGRNVAAAIRGRPMRRFAPTDLGWVIPLSEVSAGRVLGKIRIGGTFGLRAHYLMCAIRHFGASQAASFLATTLVLRRRPDAPPQPDAAAGGRGEPGQATGESK